MSHNIPNLPQIQYTINVFPYPRPINGQHNRDKNMTTNQQRHYCTGPNGSAHGEYKPMLNNELQNHYQTAIVRELKYAKRTHFPITQ